jgi:hypothetical protein
VPRLNDHADGGRLECVINHARDLRSQLLLHLQIVLQFLTHGFLN